MPKKFKKIDGNTLEIEATETKTVTRTDLEQNKAGLEVEIATLTAALAEVNEQLDVLA